MEEGFVVLVFVGFLVGGIGGCMYNDVQKDKARAEVKVLQEKYTTDVTDIKGRYNSLSCKMRGYVVEEVEGIKLCMEPVTRSLHKIDEVKDSK